MVDLQFSVGKKAVANGAFAILLVKKR